jgi:hypothetical protein
MKSFCSILILILTMHSACAGVCLASHLAAPSQTEAASPPPCHQAASVPTGDKPSRQDDGACGQASAQASSIDVKIKASFPHELLQAAMPAVSPLVVIDVIESMASAVITPLDTSPPPVSVHILRI